MLNIFGGEEGIVTALVLCGTVFLGLALWRFLMQERYRGPGAVLSPVEREWAVRRVGEAFAELAPRALLLNRLETAVGSALRDGSAGGPGTDARGRLERVGLDEFWRDFARASALGEEDPARAVCELRRVGVRLERCLEELEEIGRALRVGQGGRVSAEGEKDAGE